MAKPPASIKPIKPTATPSPSPSPSPLKKGRKARPALSQCHACGEFYTAAFFSSAPLTSPDVCNICLLDTNGIPPTDLPFSPENLDKKSPAPTAPTPDTAHILPDFHDVTITDDIESLEVAERVLMQRSLLAFTKRFKSDYKAGWVHEDICRRLERFMKDVEDGKSPRLLLCMPPRHGKSTLTSNNFPPWVLGHHPDWEIIAASHTQSLALKFSGIVRDRLRDPAYTATFPTSCLDPNSQSKEFWETTAGGGYLAAGVATGITGRGAHILIIDDPVKDMESADSITMRDNIWEWYTSTAYTRLAPGGGVLGILTLWNEDDWGGRIIEISESGDGDKFEIVRYPAVNDGYAEYLHPDTKTIVQVYPTPASTAAAVAAKDPLIATPPPQLTEEEAANDLSYVLLRPPDTALHPARYSYKALMAIKKNYFARGNQRVWSALYQQCPTPEDGIFFTKGMLRYYSVPPARRGRTIYQAWDFAITEKQKSDWTVGITLLQDENDSLYLLDVNRFRSDDSTEIATAIIDYAMEWDVDLLGFEDGQIWKTLKAQWEKACKERAGYHYPPYEALVPLTDKKVRAMPLRGRMQLGKIYIPVAAPWLETFKKELLAFPAYKHDDQVDATAWGVRLTLTRAAPRPPIAKTPEKSWRDKLTDTTGAENSHMAA